VIQLDARLRRLREHARGWGADLREIALDVDRAPDSVHRYLDLDVMRFLATWRRSRVDESSVVLDGHRFYIDSAIEQVVFLEELAYGDAGALLAAPGAPMAGPLVQLLGDERQQEWFFGTMRETVGWAFFALTEPDHGSDASHLDTTLKEHGDGFQLDGAKRYVGNAARSRLGVVFARSGPGPLGVRAVMVDTSAPGFTATVLPTVGLRGLQLTAIDLASVEVPADRVLGQHLNAARRGAWAWSRTFNLLRPGVAAIAIGVARAALDYVAAYQRLSRPAQARWDELSRRVDGVRQLAYHAAVAVDADRGDGGPASAAKARAARLAEEVTLAALEFFGPGARLDHPLLDKLARDARGFEFMEGTGHVQRLLVAQDLIRGRER